MTQTITPRRATPKAMIPSRFSIAARALTAVIGGYLLANAVSILLSYALYGIGRTEAVMIGLLFSFSFYTLAAIWVFAVRSPMKACLGVWGMALVCSALVWWLGPFGNGGGV